MNRAERRRRTSLKQKYRYNLIRWTHNKWTHNRTWRGEVIEPLYWLDEVYFGMLKNEFHVWMHGGKGKSVKYYERDIWHNGKAVKQLSNDLSFAEQIQEVESQFEPKETEWPFETDGRYLARLKRPRRASRGWSYEQWPPLPFWQLGR